MPALDAAQRRNLKAALAVASTRAEWERLAFAIFSESRGYIYANDGRNTSKSPNITPERAEILKRSLLLPYDRVGSNGRSTGMLQQISSEVGGTWGDMAGTMDPAESARRYLRRLVIHEQAGGKVRLTTDDGGLEEFDLAGVHPVAADVLRVQQPLLREAQSTNYSNEAVRTALNAASEFPFVEPREVPEPDWWTDMAATFDEAKAELVDVMKGSRPVIIYDVGSGWYYYAAPGEFRPVQDVTVQGVKSFTAAEIVNHAVGAGLWPKPVGQNVIQIAAIRAATGSKTEGNISYNGEYV